MRFQWPGGVTVPAPSAQNQAMIVCSGVRFELSARPSALTSLKSAVYSVLVSSGGGGGRNPQVRGSHDERRHLAPSAAAAAA